MDERFSKLKEVFDPAVKLLLELVPDSYGKERGVAKLQECIWWCEKAIYEENQKEKAKEKTDDQPAQD